MPTTTRAPIRKGVPITFSIDPDSKALLRAMVPNGRGLGLFLSELIRKEARERTQRPQWIASLAALHDGNGLVT